MTARRTVLVTGAAGFIGRHVARAYAREGAHVIGVGHDAAGDANAKELGVAQWVRGSVFSGTLQSLGVQPDIVVHCAGDSSVGASFSDPERGIERNLQTLQPVLDLARQSARSPRVVVLSSAAVYGAAPRLPIAEDDAVQPVSPYGQGKVAVEQLCRDYGPAHGLPIALLRLFSVYGDGQRKLLFWDACTKFAAGQSDFGGTGRERRDWLHVDDAVSLIMHAADRAVPGVVTLNGGSGRSLTVADALGHLRAAWGGATPALRFTGEARIGDPPGYEADIARATAGGWTPKVRFENGIEAYARWARRILM